MTSEIAFDKEAHAYYVDGRRVPSVTQILREWILINGYYVNVLDGTMIHRSKMERSREYGSAFHEALKLYVENDLDEDSLHPDLRAAFEQFKLWYASNDVEPIAIEKPIFNRQLMYAGTPDLVAKVRGRPAVIEYKTGSHLMAGPQTAAYANALSHQIYRRYVLYFPRHGYMRQIELDSSDDFQFFRARLIEFNYLKRKGIIK